MAGDDWRLQMVAKALYWWLKLAEDGVSLLEVQYSGSLMDHAETCLLEAGGG